MSPTGEQIKEKAIEILSFPENAEGMRYTELVNAIQEVYPKSGIPIISAAVAGLTETHPDKVYKPDRGLYRHTSFKEDDGKAIASKIVEEDYYKPFADYLMTELEECTKAIALGGKKFGDKWGTPDVIGIKKPKKSDIIEEIVITSAEIKTDPAGLITAFGQACAYKLFSHKVYLVIPIDSIKEDKSRIESLCLIFGVGLVLFNTSKTSSEKPPFEIRVRPYKHEPDTFYVNKYIKLIEHELFD